MTPPLWFKLLVRSSSHLISKFLLKMTDSETLDITDDSLEFDLKYRKILMKEKLICQCVSRIFPVTFSCFFLFFINPFNSYCKKKVCVIICKHVTAPARKSGSGTATLFFRCRLQRPILTIILSTEATSYFMSCIRKMAQGKCVDR